MDALLMVAVEEVGLEGREGCSVEALWSLVSSRLPIGSITCLPPQLQAMLWDLLRQRTDDVQLYLPSPANLAGADLGVAAMEGKKPKGRSKNAVDLHPLSKATKLTSDDPRVRDSATAAANGVRLMASEAVRMSVLGVYEIQDSRFPLSDSQLSALEVVGRTRWRGTINADLANRLGIAYRNFYYIVKNLETRKLVVKNPVVFAPPGATVTVSSVLHLPRFQPAVKLGPGQMFKTVDAVRGMEVATYVLQDDNLYMRLVCNTIAETEERLVAESDLKLVCGFRGTRGHRLWRRLRRKLEDQGFMSFETCRVRDRLVPCVRLLKDWKPPAAAEGDEPEGGGEDADEGEGEEGGEGGGGAVGRSAIHVAELSMERQLLDCILSAGSDGVLNYELFAKLGVSSKVYGGKLIEVIKRYNIQVTVVNRGRIVLNRLVAPAELLAAAGYTLPPPAPALPQLAAAVAAPATDANAVVEGAAARLPAAKGVVPPSSGAGPSGAVPATAATLIKAIAAPPMAKAKRVAGKISKGAKKAMPAREDGVDARAATAAAAAAEAEASKPRPKRSAALKASEEAAKALLLLGNGGGGDSDEDYTAADAEEEEQRAAAAEISEESESDESEEEDKATEELEEEQEEEGKKAGRKAGAAVRSPGSGGRGRGRGSRPSSRPAKRPRLAPAGAVPLVPAPLPLPAPPAAAAAAGAAGSPAGVAASTVLAPTLTPTLTAMAAAAAARKAAPVAASNEAATAAAAGGAAKEKKPHWTKVITLKTEDRLRLLVEHLQVHRFISRVQVRRLVMEWESAVSGKPIPNSTAGPDIKTIRRLMDRLAESGKAKLIRVETPGFLGDNRPIDTLLRPDLEETPELLQEIRKQMAEFEKKLRSDCCRKALAARKLASQTENRIGNLLPPEMAEQGPQAAAVGGAGGAGGATGATGATGGPENGADGLLRAAGLQALEQGGGADTVREGTWEAAAPGARTGRRGPRRAGGGDEDAASLRLGRGMSLFRVVNNEATARSVENGLIPAKMVRVRLLHFLIAKLVGLGGFDADPLSSVDPDPASMPHMPQTLGEEVLSLASATERSRMAFAFGAMKGGSLQQQMGQQQAAQQGQRQRQAGGAGGEAGGGAAGAGDGAGTGGAGAGGQQAPAATTVRHLSVRRLWSIMPLSVALQVLGSTSRRPPGELARLCESGATLGSLSAEQARDIMDGTSVHRLEYLISILRRLRLLEWAVVDPDRMPAVRRPGPGAGVRARGGQGVMLLVHGRGFLEIPPGKELSTTPAQPPAATGAATGEATAAAAAGSATGTGAAEGATAAGAPGAGAAASAVAAAPAAGGAGSSFTVFVSAPSGFSGNSSSSGRFIEVDLTSAAGLDEYWRRFEELYRLEGSNTHAEVQRLRKCFPSITVPEVLSRNSWFGQRLMTAVQWLRLQSGLDQINLRDGTQITSLASQLGIDVEVVTRIVSDRRRRQIRLMDAEEEEEEEEEREREGLEGGRMAPLRLARLYLGLPGVAVQGGGGSTQARSGTPDDGDDVPALPAGTRRRLMKRRSMRRASPATRERLLAERAAVQEAKAARKAARVAKRAEKDAAKAARRAARLAGTYVVHRRKRSEILAERERERERAEAERAAGQPEHKRRRRWKEGEGEEQGGEGERRKSRRQSDAAAAGGSAEAARHNLLPPSGAAAAGRGGSDSGSGSDGGGGFDGDELGPHVRMPSMAAPTRMTRVLWTVSEDRALLTEYIKLAAESGPHIRLAWKPRATVLPYSIPVCTRHIRYLKRNYPSYTGRLDELLRRAHEKKIELARLQEKSDQRTALYQDRVRRRRAGEEVAPLDENGEELRPERRLAAQLMQQRDPVDMTRAIVMADGVPVETPELVLLPRPKDPLAEAAAAEPPPPPVLPPQAAVEAAATADGEPTAQQREGSAPPLPPAAVSAEVEEPGVDPAEAALQRRLAEREAQQAAQLISEREAAVAEALSLMEDFVLVLPRRSSQRLRDRLQQQGGLELGARLAPAASDAQTQRRALAAARRSLGGALQGRHLEDPGAAAAAVAAAAAAAEDSKAMGAASAQRRRGSGSASASAATLLIVPVHVQLQLPRPSLSVTAAMCMLASLLYQVRAVGGLHGWMSQQVVDALGEFGRRFPPETKAAALKQMQLRGWLAPTGPKRQLDLTPAFLSRLHGTELPTGLLCRCGGAAARLDVLIGQAAAAAARIARRALRAAADDEDDDDADAVTGGSTAAVAARAASRAAAAAASAEGTAVDLDSERAGSEAVERTCLLDAGRGVLMVEPQEQLPSELVAVVLARQATGRLELHVGDVDMQPEWVGQAGTVGPLVTSVQLMIAPPAQDAVVAAAAAASGGRGCGEDVVAFAAAAPAAAGTPVVVSAALAEHTTAETAAAATDTRHHHQRDNAAAAATTSIGHHDQGQGHGSGTHAQRHGHPHGSPADATLASQLHPHGTVAYMGPAEAGPAASSAGTNTGAPAVAWPWAEPRGMPADVRPLYAPSTVAADPVVKAAAAAGCKSHLAGEVTCSLVVLEELLEAVEALLDDAGPEGLTFGQLMAKLREAASGGVKIRGSAPPAPAGEASTAQPAPPAPAAEAGTETSAPPAPGAEAGMAQPAQPAPAAEACTAQPAPQVPTGEVGTEQQAPTVPAAEAGTEQPVPLTPPEAVVTLSVVPIQALLALVLRALELYGLARRVGGWDAVLYLASAHGQDAIVAIPAAQPRRPLHDHGVVSAPGAADGADAMDTDGPPPAPRERPLRPWFDHRGEPNIKMWAALVPRVLGLVMRHPGIPEDLLVASLEVVPPQAAREVLHHLAETGRLEVRTTPQPQHRRRPALLGGGGGDGVLGGGGAGGGCGGKPVVHYLPVLEECTSEAALRVLPP